MSRQRVILAGLPEQAKAYAGRRGLDEDDYIIVTRGDQIARLDPHLVRSIVLIDLHALGEDNAAAIVSEFDRMSNLWTVEIEEAA